MKCVYAISPDAIDEARGLCDEYAAALASLSAKTIDLADELRAFAEESSAAVMKIDDEEWRSVREAFEQQHERLAGEIFWSVEAAGRAQRVLDAADTSARVRPLAVWLGAQASRGRAIVLVAG